MKAQNARSFTAAGTLPWKLLQIKEQCIGPDRRIAPVHIQLLPTNKCNGTCPWCSCAERDKSLELPIHEIYDLVKFFKERGAKAVTITGGGEPTLHPDFYNIISAFNDADYSIGLVTNGIKWGKDSIGQVGFLSGAIDWVRISTMDTTQLLAQPDWLANIASQLKTCLGVSFTVSEAVNVKLAQHICSVAARFDNITHIRFVDDILDPHSELMDDIEAHCAGLTDKGIYQRRSTFTKGAKPCLISRMKPLIGANGQIYPCCGVQYANEAIGLRRMPDEFAMGHWSEYDSMEPFDGSVCTKCYYSDYNKVLDGLTRPLQHIYHV